MIRQSIVALTLSFGAAAALVSSASAPAEDTSPGRTATRLPDGRLLLIGGQGSSGPESDLAVFDASTQATVRLNARLREPRAWHTATILPTGAILIAGGIGSDGRALTTAERFDLATETLTPISISGAGARAGHTATLLTDGRMLLVGGHDGAGGLVADSEVWDLEGGHAKRIAGLQPRTGHSASLLADGRVRISGGASSDDIFDPRSERGRPVTDPVVEPPAAALIAESEPRNNARDVALDSRITLRFSHQVDPDTVTAQSVVVAGPEGPLATLIVVAESGRLAFVWPLNRFEADTAYRVNLEGLRDRTGALLQAGQVSFTTIKGPKETTNGEEIWRPDPSDPGTWETHRPPSPWQSLQALQAEPGATAVAGQVLTLDGRPLRGVTLEIGADSTRTDNTGRFLLRLPHGESGRRELGIDGSTANRADKVYGFFEYGLTVSAGTTTVLPFTIWMPRLDVEHEVTIPSPTIAETVITTPYVPGLELHLPPRTVVRDEEGKPVTRLGITPIPVDRPPFPLARNIDVPVYFTVQPGGAYVRSYGTGKSGAWVVYPNYRRTSAPGQVLQFFHYDPEEKDWYVYGLGTVTPDGAQVVPDANTRLYEFTGAMLQTGDPVPGGGWTPGGPGWADPVDPSTGVFGLHKTDLYLPDVIPIALTRTYNSADTAVARPFGRGMTHPYAMFLWSAQQWQQADLILPEGGRIHYIRTSPGTSWTDAVFVHQETQTTSATPTAWYKSVISWNGHGWNLQRKDGMVFVFGENAPLQAIRDRYGNTLTITRTNGQAGNITRVTSPHGRWIAFTYDSSNHVTQAMDNIGRIVRYTYGSGNLATVTDAENGVTTYSWTASNQVATITDPRGITFLSNTYTNGRVTAQATGDGTSTTQFAYTLGPSGAVTQTDITDPRGHRERLVFNADHYIVSDIRGVGQPEQQAVTFERQPGANFTTATVDGLGRRTEFQFDAVGHVVRATRLAGTSSAASTVVSYEPQFSQPASIVDPMGHAWTFSYDAAGNLTSVVDPVGRRTATTYEAGGRITSVTNPLQQTWRFAYRGADLASVTDPLEGTSRVFFDAAGRLVATTDPLGRTARFVWNRSNQVAAATDAIGGVSSWTYDGNGNTLEFSDPLDHLTRYTYDAFDRLASRTDPLSQSESQQYDANDNLTRRVDRKGQATTYQYDALGRVTLVTFADASTIAYSYDAGDRVTQMSDSANGTLSWQYDLLDRVTQESTPSGSVSYTYDADGRRIAMTVSGQPGVSYTYDDSHRLTGVAQGTAAVAIAYDAAGRRQSVTFPNGIAAGYGYDAADRLSSLAYSLGSTSIGNLTYEYDAAGNRTAMDGTLSRTSLPAGVASATYDAANRIVERAGVSFAHDPNGNVTNDGLHAFQWNARDLLTSVTGGTSGVFQYDAMGRRRAKTVGGATTRFLHDGLNVVQEQTAVGVPTANMLGGLRLDETFMRTESGAGMTVLTDVLGSTLGLADATGNVTTDYSYAPFGATTTSGAASTNSAQFTGRENDGAGLHYYRARYYAPDLGRFLSEDPLEFGGGDANLYAYAGNRPTGATDPLGLYNRDVHFDLTDAIGRQVGMCTANAIRIAMADQGVDEDPWTTPMAPLNLDARSWYHFTTSAQLGNLRQRAFGSGQLSKMGVYLHAFQDSFAHQTGRKDRNGDGYGPSVGHFFQLHGPDDPRKRPDLWRRMAAATASELSQFHERFPACQTEPW